MTGHTKGPWDFEADETSSGMTFSVYDEHGLRLTEPYIDEDASRLIAAAPYLLAALERAREAVNAIVVSTRSVSFTADLRAIDAAIYLAKRGSSQVEPGR